MNLPYFVSAFIALMLAPRVSRWLGKKAGGMTIMGLAIALAEAWSLAAPRRWADVPVLERPRWTRRLDAARLSEVGAVLADEAVVIHGIVLMASRIVTVGWRRRDLAVVAERPFLLESVAGMPRYRRVSHDGLAVLVPAAHAVAITDLLDQHAASAST